MDSADNSSADADATTVFFSYSRADQDIALPIISLLEQAGFKVWWDGMLGAGVQYLETTEEALESAKAVVVLWTETSTASNWVRDEAMSGRERGCLVPISVDGSLPPLGFRQFQVLDLSACKGKHDFPAARELLRALAELHERDVPDMPLAGPVSPLLTPTRRKLLLGGIGGGIVIGGGFAIASFLDLGGGTDGNSIAVLPFRNDSPDAEQGYLAAGIAAELRSMLAVNPALRVIARSTSEAVQQRGDDAMMIANELGLDFVVEGSVRVVDGIANLSADLIEGASGLGRWSRTYSQPADDLLGLQQELASAISSQLSLQIADVQGSLQTGEASVPAAYEAYLKGWEQFIEAQSHEALASVLLLFESATRLDPEFAGAWAGQAATLTFLGHSASSAEATQQFYTRAQDAANRAIELGPDLAEAHSLLGTILFETQLQAREAAPYYERSIELGAGGAVFQARYAAFAAFTGRENAALRAIETAIDLDPLNPTIFKEAGMVHYAARRFDRAIELHRQALSMNPQISGSHSWIGSSLIRQGDYPAAVEACLQEPSRLLRTPCLAIVYHLQGAADQAQEAMAELVDSYGDAGLYQQAQVLSQWGKAEEAMLTLRNAYEIGDAGLNYLAMDPMLDPLRDRADFIDLQQRLGFTPFVAS